MINGSAILHSLIEDVALNVVLLICVELNLYPRGYILNGIRSCLDSRVDDDS